MTKRTKSKRFRIAVLISPDMGVRRESLRGVYHYASGKTDWDLSLMWPLEESMWKSLVRQPMEGALVWPKFEAEVEHLGPLKVPIVTIGSLAHAGHSSVFFDNRAAARIGVEELATKGLKSVAFYGSRSNFRYGVERRLGYLKTVKTLGLSENVLAEEVSEPKWARLERWLRALPKPSGVLADTDVGGLSILSAAQRCRIAVPDRLSLISIGGDDLICPLGSPSLSSVVLPGFEAGMEAACMLDTLLKKTGQEQRCEVIMPRRVVERRSSQFFSVGDIHVSKALRYIRDHAEERLSVADVLNEVPLSRRPLEKRFREFTGKTIQKAIWKAKLDLARRLLWETSLSVAEISEACGFIEPQRMTEVFKRELDMSPSDYRDKYSVKAIKPAGISPT